MGDTTDTDRSSLPSERIAALEATIADLQRRLEDLSTSEQRCRGILEQAPLGIFRSTPDGRLLEVNPALARMFGYSTPEQMFEALAVSSIGDTLYAVPGRRLDLVSRLQQEPGRWLTEKERFKRRDGSEFVGRLNIRSVASNGSVELHGFVEDISQQDEAERALRESEEQFRLLFETMAQGVIYQEADGTISRANPAAQRIMGLTEPQITERTSDDPRWVAIREDGSPFPGRDHPTQVALRTGQEVRDVVIGIWNPRLQEHRWLRTTAIPLFRRGEPRPYQAYVVFDDITEARQHSEQLRLLAELVDAAPSAITVHDYDGRFLFANAGALALHGYTREEFLALNLHDLDVPESEVHIEERMAELREHGQASFEVRHRRKDGSEIPLLVTIRNLRWNNQDVILSNALDLSKREADEARRLEVERRLMRLQRLESLGTLAGGIAHDFNNLLMAVLGNLDLALTEMPAGSPAQASVLDAVSAARRAAQLSRQMLMYTGRTAFSPDKVELARVIEDGLGLLRSALSESVTLDVHVDSGDSWIRADAGELQQLLVNLVTNAAEAYAGNEGTVSITTGRGDYTPEMLVANLMEDNAQPGSYVWLEVSDKGCGMDRATLDRLFEPFFSTKFVGRGLGMAAVHGIIRSHHGAVMVNTVPGQGCTVRVLLPALSAADREAVPAPVGESPVSSAASDQVAPAGDLVLVVDDDPAVLLLTTRMLARLGYEALTASGGREAVALFRARRDQVAAVIVDLAMPDMDGIATIRELRAIDPAVRVLLATGYTEDEAASRLGEGESVGIVLKPYRLDSLRARLEDLLAGERA